MSIHYLVLEFEPTNLSNMSRVPLPLDQGSRPTILASSFVYFRTWIVGVMDISWVLFLKTLQGNIP